jgi:Uma2 family endonuclease
MISSSQLPKATMTVAKSHSTMRVETGQGDIRTIQWGRTWEQFKHLQKGFENTRGVRLFYYNGTVEILMPSEAHELFKSIIGFLVETFLFHRAIEFKPTGSMTQEKAGIASAEADESYEIEGFKLSIEVNFTRGDPSKLQRYEALGVHEVWIWEDGVLAVYHLQSGRHEKVSHSLIPALSLINLNVMLDCILIGETSRITAAKKLLEAYPIAP